MLKSDIAAATDTLATTGWLAGTPQDFRDCVLANCQWRRFAAGQSISHGGDADGSPIGIARGSATITTVVGRADTPIIHIMHAGTWFGYMPLFVPDRVVSVVARTDSVLAILPQRLFEGMLARRPEWWRHAGQLPAMQLATALGVIADLTIRDSHERCAAALLQLSEQRLDDGRCTVDHEVCLSQQELAAIANLSRTSVSAILHGFETAGLIEIGYRAIVIKQPAKLRAIAEAE